MLTANLGVAMFGTWRTAVPGPGPSRAENRVPRRRPDRHLSMRISGRRGGPVAPKHYCAAGGGVCAILRPSEPILTLGLIFRTGKASACVGTRRQREDHAG